MKALHEAKSLTPVLSIKHIRLSPNETVMKNKKTGYVCLYRSIKNHWLWRENRVKTNFEAWIDLLFRASHEDQKEPVGIDFVVVKKGQVLTSQLQLSKDWFWSRKKVCNFLSVLQRDGMLAVETTSKWSMLTICNYASYHEIGTSKEHQDLPLNPKTGQKKGTKKAHDNGSENQQLASIEEQQKNNKGTSEEHIQALETLEEYRERGGKPPTRPKGFKQWSELEFIDDIKKYSAPYEKDMLNAFFKYWSEKSPSEKMKFQLQPTWETKKRLESWNRKEETNFKNK